MDRLYTGALSDENIRAVFDGAGDFCIRELHVADTVLYAYFIDGLTSGGDISDFVLRPLAEKLRPGTPAELYEQAKHGVVWNSVADPCPDLDTAARKLVNGFCVVLIPGAGAVAYEDKTPEKRSPSEPEVENTSKGPKDAFTETVRTNTSLLRRHLRTPRLRLFETVVGRQTLTNVTVVSIDGLTDPSLVERMKRRLQELDVEGLLSPAAVEEYVTGSRKTAFPMLQYTERTDKFAAGLLSGRVGLLVDGLPLGYLAPVNLGWLMQSPEDRGTDYLSASAIRLVRYLALLVTLLLPALYVAMAAFHQQMIPTKLLLAIIESKQNVPFPTVLEVLGLLLSFEVLQEAGMSLPKSISQSVSIIGGLVVGSAAVEAKIISPGALIVVSVAGICGFAVPGKELSDALRLWRFALTVAAALAGMYGLTVGCIVLLLRLSSLESFGRPWLAPFSGVRTGGAVLRRRLVAEKSHKRDGSSHSI